MTQTGKAQLSVLSPPCKWRIRLLGEFACAGIREVNLGSRKAALVLARLALGDRPVQRDELGDLLWPDEPSEVSRPRLRQALASVNRSCGAPSPISAQRNEVGLSADCSVDVRDFKLHLQNGDARAAFDLYRPLLPGWGEDWLRPYRQSLRDQFQRASLRLAADLEKQGEVDESLQVLARSVQLEPLDECLQLEYLKGLCRAGLQAKAIGQYEDYAALLGEQVGLPPSPAIAEVVQNAKRLGRSQTPRVSSPSPLSPQALPGYISAFFGREKALADLERLFDQGRRLVTVTGIGGIGKTRLSLEFARRACDRYDAVAWVPLVDVSDPQLIVPSVHHALGLSAETMGDPLVAIVRAVAGRPCLLVVDNFEHLPSQAAAILRGLVEKAPSLTALVTSRNPLEIPGEQEVPLEPLYAQGDDPNPAVELFLDRVRLVSPSAEDTEADHAAANQIVRDLDGIPLALELAAAQCRLLTIRELAIRVNEQPASLTTSRADFEPRHRKLREVLIWSLDSLSPQARELFGTLAVFRGSFTVKSASAVFDGSNVESLLEELLVRSLVIQTAAHPLRRFRFLVPIRELALESSDPAILEGPRRRMVDYFVEFATDADFTRSGATNHSVPIFEEEVDNIRESMRIARETDHGKGLQLAIRYGRYCNHDGNQGEGRRWLEEFLSTNPSVERHFVGHAHFVIGAGYAFQGEEERAIEVFRQALANASATHQAYLYLNMSWQYVATGRFRRSHEAILAGLDAAPADAPSDLKPLLRLGEIVARSAFDPALDDEDALWRVYADQKLVKSTWSEVMSLFQITEYYVFNGKGSRALEVCDLALREAEAGRHWANYLGHAHYRTQALIQTGRLDEAQSWIGEIRVRAREQGSRNQPLLASLHEGTILGLQGRDDEARQLLLEARSEALQLPAQYVAEGALRALAGLGSTDPDEASALLADARSIRDREGIILTPYERDALRRIAKES